MASNEKKKRFRKVAASLADLAGEEYTQALCASRAWLTNEKIDVLQALANQKVDFFPGDFQQRLLSLLPQVGRECCKPLKQSARGAASNEFQSHTHKPSSPLSGLGYFRVGENGCLHLISKSEHYHAPLGHSFPGYRLLEHARRLGIPNATHNNTRGHITRRLEEELVRTAAGLSSGDASGLNRLLESKSKSALNRVLNLETGSLAAEAALKMVLNRFYRSQPGAAQPKYYGRLPVLLVLGDDQGDLKANYHGTTFLTQLMRGMWPDFLESLETNQQVLIRAVRPNHLADLDGAFDAYEQGAYKIAGFFHELVMMNYGALTLNKSYVRRLYALCKQHDVPTIVDEIQTCIWSPDIFMHREYGVKPTFLAVGKGIPGGEYPASRILFSSEMDTLPQFGALVTNGQEEISSLAYLITMRWAEKNSDLIRDAGDYYQEKLNELASRSSNIIQKIEGKRHLAGIVFNDLKAAQSFTSCLNRMGMDISVQTYKDGCPPVALTKLPLIMEYQAVDFIIQHMEEAIRTING
ncbi:MAG: aminotransferase class III-fold pyridoxal phosphate-dependent enzyme [Candidatus Omnitrophica bacterium]|nr:aminotransferase class III-fold pyridoxal phosphate-dependent enzyme [Candidatus Omnitrophota bacterium]